MEKVSILVVDDSFFMRKIISDILNSEPIFKVVGEATNGNEALQKINELKPDVVTLDYEMPHLNGLETLKKIMEMSDPPPVIVVSGYVYEGADITLDFLDNGAVDFILKPSGVLSLDMNKVQQQLIEKVKAAASVDPQKKIRLKTKRYGISHALFKKNDGIVVIGSSTGGPAALQVILGQFPENFPLPVVLAQHLPKEFADSFTERLSRECKLKVIRAKDGMPINPGTIYLAPGGHDTETELYNGKKVLKVVENNVDIETPSVNKLMISAANIYSENTIGVILTGMGNDGSLGMAQIKKRGGITLVQDKQTSVIYGMGKEVIEKKLADIILPLDKIIEKIVEILS